MNPHEWLGGVDRDDARPLHAQIRDIVHRSITDNVLPPGSPLPTEDELQRHFAVSRSVIRQALSSLSDMGLIHRQRGRGSVVTATPVLHRSLQRAGGLHEQAAARGQRLRTHVLSVEPVTAPADVEEALDTSDAWEIERIRFLEDTPVVLTRTWVPRQLFPHFTAELLEGSSLLGLIRDHGYRPAGGPRNVQAVAADAALARALEVERGAPLLLLEGTTRDADGSGLETFSVWHRANTVFDVDAQVDSEQDPSVARPAEISRLRTLAEELHVSLSRLEG